MVNQTRGRGEFQRSSSQQHGVNHMATLGICVHVAAFQILILVTVLNIQNILWTGWCVGASSLVLLCVCYGRNVRGFAIGISTIVFCGIVYATINWFRWNAMLSQVRIPPVLIVSQVAITICSLISIPSFRVRLPMIALNRYRIRDLLVHTAIVAIVLALFRIPASYADTTYSLITAATAQICVIIVLVVAWHHHKQPTQINDEQRHAHEALDQAVLTCVESTARAR